MKRLAVVVPALDGGGGVPAVARFIKDAALRDGRYDVKMFSLCMSSRDPASLEFRHPLSWFRGVGTRDGVWEGVPFRHVGAFLGEIEFQRYQPRAALSALLADCDIIQMVCGAPAWANAVIGLGKPVALHVATRTKVERRVRDAAPKSVMDYWRKVMTQITDRMDDKALRSADAIQLMNPWMLNYAQALNQGRVGAEISYAPPGVDAQLFRPSHGRGASPNPYILCVGRLDDPRKNIGLLLEAFIRLPQTMEHVHLVTAGAGKPPVDYWAKVHAMGLENRVRHVHRPEVEDLVALYQQAAAFALTSDEEGFGVVVLEAMACGVPVVSTRCGGPDGIIADGEDGFMVPLADAEGMASRLALLCADRDLNRALGLQARRTVEERYADEVAGRAFTGIWERLLEKAEKC